LVHGEHPWVVPNTAKGDQLQLLYNEITHTKLQFFTGISEEFKNLITGLLHVDSTKRFGPQEIKSHSFFRNISWDMVRQKKLKPPFCPNPNAMHFSPKAMLDDQLGLYKEDSPPMSTSQQELFKDWDWTNPKYPSGLSMEERDIIFFRTVQQYTDGLEIFQASSARPRGRIIFSLKELPENLIMYTQRGTCIERKSLTTVLVGSAEIEITK